MLQMHIGIKMHVFLLMRNTITVIKVSGLSRIEIYKLKINCNKTINEISSFIPILFFFIFYHYQQISKYM